jgi:glycosyltransferase involved in cell wall biosynthesis
LSRMTFIVYAQISAEKLTECLGMPEYSYHFVLRGFLPVLRELGDVIVVRDPPLEVDGIYEDCRRRDEACVFITFSPPNKSAVGLRCPTVCVLAWEFDRIPDEVWDDDPKNDWRTVFADHGRVITLSRYSAAAVKKAMGEGFPVAAIPVPVWDNFHDYRDRMADSPVGNHHEIFMKGNIVDSRDYHIAPDLFELKTPADGFHLQEWAGGTLRLGFTEADESAAYLGGFYQPEPWGTWSRIEKPWVLIPYRISGRVQFKIVLCGYAANANREISVSLGDEIKRIRLGGGFTEICVSFQLSRPDNVLKFSGLDLSPVIDAPDPRSMGIGLRHIEISVDPEGGVPTPQGEVKEDVRKATLAGVVYTSVFNPGDDRKNWTDLVKGFCMAFQDVEDATLVLKMTHHALSSFLGKLHFLLQQMWPFKCRIVALHGYLEDSEYEKLIAATAFYVNTSRCEGLCLPLMEFMACGKPAIAPCNTSLADYVDASNTLIVQSSVEPGIWPHDPRRLFRALRYRIDWWSLVSAYRKSYAIVKNQPEIYQGMAESAMLKMKAYSSNSMVKEKLKRFLNSERALPFSD